MAYTIRYGIWDENARGLVTAMGCHDRLGEQGPSAWVKDLRRFDWKGQVYRFSRTKGLECEQEWREMAEREEERAL